MTDSTFDSQMADAAAPTTPKRATSETSPRLRWPSIAVLAIFGLLYAWDVWEAIENLIVLPGERQSLGLPVPWSALIAGLVIPIAVFFMAVGLGRRRRLLERAGLLLAGLCLVAVLTLSLTAYVRAGGL